ncbi:flagellar hook-length control protein FliK [Alteribacter natronophilus]|uniref:flagellar hook-length control protein FliK n=1 Tax=Alteribacter natronophilus TaxID=2583810 RepID=UPI00110E763F|nr:flagellar hook-length control protein FliK [Alteribacter natronophilus]TMW73217.1 flagellar hook-length control protein FliK [Alteribacter natronophilus]
MNVQLQTLSHLFPSHESERKKDTGSGKKLFSGLLDLQQNRELNAGAPVARDPDSGNREDLILGNLLLTLSELPIYIDFQDVVSEEENLLELIGELPDELKEEAEMLISESETIQELLKADLPDELKLEAVFSAVERMLTGDFLSREERSRLLSGFRETVQAFFISAGMKERNADQSVNPPHENRTAEKILHRLEALLSKNEEQLAERNTAENRGEKGDRNALLLPSERERLLRSIITRHTGEPEGYTGKVARPPESLQSFSRVMPAVQQHSLLAGEEQKQEDRVRLLIRQFDSILSQRIFRQESVQQISVRLHPEHLGKMDVTLTQNAGQLTARIAVSAPLTREMVEQNIHQLRQAFLHQNLNVEKIEISQLPGQADEEPDRRDREKENEQHAETDDSSGEVTDFSNILEETLNIKV